MRAWGLIALHFSWDRRSSPRQCFLRAVKRINAMQVEYEPYTPEGFVCSFCGQRANGLHVVQYLNLCVWCCDPCWTSGRLRGWKRELRPLPPTS